MNIVELAKSLDLSIGTVSRALNDRPEVSADTRQRVLTKAREVGFTPNTNARRLVTGKNFLIGLECPDNTHILADPFLVQLARHVEEVVGAQGYDLLLRLGASRRSPESAWMSGVDGLILVAAPHTRAEDIRALTQEGRVPAVILCGPEPLVVADCACVCLDTLPGVREAFQLFAQMGHRRIGYIGSAQPGCRVRAALPSILQSVGLMWQETLACEAGTSQEEGYAAARRLLCLPAPPTALFARTDVLAIGAMQAAHALGLRVPADLSIIGHDDIEAARMVTPALTTVGIDTQAVSKAATQALFDMLAQNAFLKTSVTSPILSTENVSATDEKNSEKNSKQNFAESDAHAAPVMLPTTQTISAHLAARQSCACNPALLL